MKRSSKYILIILALMLILTSCGQGVITTDKEVYTAYNRGVGYRVDTVNMTITPENEEFVIKYAIDDMTVTITYPDNSTYWWTVNATGGFGGWSDDYDAEKYLDGNILIGFLKNVLPTVEEEQEEKNVFGLNKIFAFVFAAVGLFYIAFPKKAWYINQGWQLKDARPSDTALSYYRIGGAFIILIGVFMFFL